MSLHATTFSMGGNNRPLPELSIPLGLDLRTTAVTYAVPGNGFSKAVIDTVEADPAHRVPMQAESIGEQLRCCTCNRLCSAGRQPKLRLERIRVRDVACD